MLLLLALGVLLPVAGPMAVGPVAAAGEPPASLPHDVETSAPEVNGADASGTTPAAAQPRPRPRETADREQERRRAYTMGMVMLGGILICGVGLIAAALLWGSRARRIARQPLPRIAPRDELWYLKNKPDTAAAADTELEERDTPPG
jgi:hypothetical protein